MFRVLYADPPWRFGDSLPGGGRGAVKHYGVMGLDAIKRYPLPRLAPDCWLFLWRVAAMPQAALDVCEAWKFRPVAEIVWVKTLVCRNCDGDGSGSGYGYGDITLHLDDGEVWDRERVLAVAAVVIESEER